MFSISAKSVITSELIVSLTFDATCGVKNNVTHLESQLGPWRVKICCPCCSVNRQNTAVVTLRTPNRVDLVHQLQVRDLFRVLSEKCEDRCAVSTAKRGERPQECVGVKLTNKYVNMAHFYIT